MMDFVWLALAGAISGIIGGMGMGGGTLLIPILTIFLSFEQKIAQSINLLAFIPMSIFALFVHIKNKLVDFKVGVPIMSIGVIFSVFGSFLASKISNSVLQKIFGIFLLFVGFYQGTKIVIEIIKNKKNGNIKPFLFKIYIKK